MITHYVTSWPGIATLYCLQTGQSGTSVEVDMDVDVKVCVER